MASTEVRRISAKAARFTELLAPVAALRRVEHFRHMGMVWAFDVKDAKPGFGPDFHQHALERGVFIRPIGNTVYFMPPYVVGEEEMGLMAQVTVQLLD